jgi:hypothetical protein
MFRDKIEKKINKENDKNTTIKKVMTIYGLRKRMQ